MPVLNNMYVYIKKYIYKVRTYNKQSTIAHLQTSKTSSCDYCPTNFISCETIRYMMNWDPNDLKSFSEIQIASKPPVYSRTSYEPGKAHAVVGSAIPVKRHNYSFVNLRLSLRTGLPSVCTVRYKKKYIYR
jgi:hypothetical protein